MDFLQRFTERERERLLSVAQVVEVSRGQTLLRRGEPGGDLYRVEDGQLEVTDTRSQPLIVLQVFGKGSMVGEMSFLDESPRSADVRTTEGAVCQRWERRLLMKVFQEEPSLGARFYEMVARMLSERVRDQTIMSSAGKGRTAATRGSERAEALGRAEGDKVRARFMEVEALLKRDRGLARQGALTALANLQASLLDGEQRLSHLDRMEFGSTVAREIHPYLVRSRLGGLAIERASGHSCDPATMHHILANKPEGDGDIGKFIDEWLLGLPTSIGLRERQAAAVRLINEAFPGEAAVRVLLVNPSASTLLRDLHPYLQRIRGEVLCVDGSAEALALVDTQRPERLRDLRVKLVQEDLGAVCLGNARSRFPPQDILVIDSLLDYVPERLGVALLGWAAGQMAPAGKVIATALGDAPDDPVFRHLLGWPVVRRTVAGLGGLLDGAGLLDARVQETKSCGLVATGRSPVPGVG